MKKSISALVLTILSPVALQAFEAFPVKQDITPFRFVQSHHPDNQILSCVFPWGNLIVRARENRLDFFLCQNKHYERHIPRHELPQLLRDMTQFSQLKGFFEAGNTLTLFTRGQDIYLTQQVYGKGGFLPLIILGTYLFDKHVMRPYVVEPIKEEIEKLDCSDTLKTVLKGTVEVGNIGIGIVTSSAMTGAVNKGIKLLQGAQTLSQTATTANAVVKASEGTFKQVITSVGTTATENLSSKVAAETIKAATQEVTKQTTKILAEGAIKTQLIEGLTAAAKSLNNPVANMAAHIIEKSPKVQATLQAVLSVAADKTAHEVIKQTALKVVADEAYKTGLKIVAGSALTVTTCHLPNILSDNDTKSTSALPLAQNIPVSNNIKKEDSHHPEEHSPLQNIPIMVQHQPNPVEVPQQHNSIAIPQQANFQEARQQYLDDAQRQRHQESSEVSPRSTGNIHILNEEIYAKKTLVQDNEEQKKAVRQDRLNSLKRAYKLWHNNQKEEPLKGFKKRMELTLQISRRTIDKAIEKLQRKYTEGIPSDTESNLSLSDTISVRSGDSSALTVTSSDPDSDEGSPQHSKQNSVSQDIAELSLRSNVSSASLSDSSDLDQKEGL